jgi:segregation and condensation protein B
MARSTARTGKLKRSKARRPSDGAGIRTERSLEEGLDPSTRHASVGELLAALDGGRRTGQDGGAEAEGSVGDGAASALEPGTQGDSAEPAQTDVTTPGDGEPARASRWVHVDPDDLGLTGFEDDDSQDEPPPALEPTPEPRPDGVELSDTLPMAPEDDLSRVKGQASPRLMSVIESLLFASDRPLTVRDIRRLLKEPTVRQVQLALKQLQIDTMVRGVVLSQVAGGFRLRTNPNNAQWVQRLLAGKPARLSRSQLEALAVIAYRQPITKAEIDHVRGVDCGAVLKLLLERNLCRIVGRKEEPGRPHLYGTTVEFLEFFNLRSLRDMPDLHEFRELTDESRATLRTEFGEEVDELESEVLGQEVLPFGGREGPQAETSELEPEGEAASEAANEAATGEGAEPDTSEAEVAADERESEPEAREVAEDDEPEADEDAEEPEADEVAKGDEPEVDEPEADEPEADEGDEPEADEVAKGEPEDDEDDADEDAEEPEVDEPEADEVDEPEDDEPEAPEALEARDDAEADPASSPPDDLDARAPFTVDELELPAHPNDDEDPEEAAS